MSRQSDPRTHCRGPVFPGQPAAFVCLEVRDRGTRPKENTLAPKSVTKKKRKPAARKPAAKNAPKRVKPAARPAAAKPLKKIAAVKPARKPVAKPVAKKSVSKPAKTAAKPARAGSKPALKPVAAKKPAAKPVAKAAPPKPAKPAPRATVPAKPAVAAKPVPTGKVVPLRPEAAKPAAMPKPAATPAAAHVAPKPAAAAAKPATAPARPLANVVPMKPVAPPLMGAPKPLIHIAPPAEKPPFAAGDFVVYPTHGVGKILGVEEQEIAGYKLSVFVVHFDKDRMTLRVPLGKAKASGLRKLSSRKEMDAALAKLRGRSRVKRTMWSRRAQEYEAKINSGDPASIAEVVRDLYRNVGQPEQSYSERQIYQAALDRLVREFAAVEKIDEETATKRIEQVLNAA